MRDKNNLNTEKAKKTNEWGKNNRIGKYLVPFTDGFLFDELSSDYLKKIKAADILTDVPIPIRKDKLSGISAIDIGLNMAFIIGCDPEFRYTANYVSFILNILGSDFAGYVIKKGVELINGGDNLRASAFFRGAIYIDPNGAAPLLNYGIVCHEIYESSDDKEKTGRFKAEALNAFERATMVDPENERAFYFLGFAYLNLGLYIKTKLTWEQFMRLSDDEESRREVQEYLDKIDEPIMIEEGYNCVLSGRFQDGIAILSKYKNDERFNLWWPLWYYLGVAYKGNGDEEEAVYCFEQGLKLSPSEVTMMEELADIYETQGNKERTKKYRDKIKLIHKNIEADRGQIC